MTEEEYFRKNYPDFCYGDKPLSPYWDLFQDGVEFGERQSEKKIEELEQENERLKGDLELWESGGCRATNLFKCGVVKELKEQLTKATELLKKLILEVRGYEEINGYDTCEPVQEAEQFLKEIEK